MAGISKTEYLTRRKVRAMERQDEAYHRVANAEDLQRLERRRDDELVSAYRWLNCELGLSWSYKDRYATLDYGKWVTEDRQITIAEVYFHLFSDTERADYELWEATDRLEKWEAELEKRVLRPVF